VCLPLLVFPCNIKSRSSLLAAAHPGSAGKRAVKWLCVLSVCEVHIVVILVAIECAFKVITFCVSSRRRKMYCGHPHLCVCL